METYYYQCIYDILPNPEKRRRRMADVNKFKAKIVQLHSASMEPAKLDVEDRVTYKDEASIYNIKKQKSRREQRTVTRILDQTNSEQTTNRGIVAVFQEFLRSKFKPISVDAECIRKMMEAVQGRLS
jgi:predicted transglutaminase-like protease